MKPLTRPSAGAWATTFLRFKPGNTPLVGPIVVRVADWSQELSPEQPVFVYCAYGFHVGCGVTAELRERGFDARYIRGGLSAWYAAGGTRALKKSDVGAVET